MSLQQKLELDLEEEDTPLINRKHNSDIGVKGNPIDDPIDGDESFYNRIRTIYLNCISDFGFYLVVCLVALSMGSTYLSTLAVKYYFKDNLHLEPATVAVCSGIVMIPWTIKPVFGLLSDSVPICGYRRFPYLIFFGLLGGLCWLLLAYAVNESLYGAISCLVGASFSMAFLNVIAEGLIIQRGKASSNRAQIKSDVTKLMSIFWGTVSISQIVCGYFAGHLLDPRSGVSKHSIFAMTSASPFLVLLFSFFVKEKRVGVADTSARSSLVTNLSNEAPPANSLISTNPSIAIAALWETISQKKIWGAILFMFIWASTPSSQSAIFFFLTEEIRVSPEFLGRLAVVEGVSSLLGLTLYSAFLSGFLYRSLLITTTILSAILGLIPLLLVLHVNRLMGIPDHYFIFGSTALLAGVGQVALMPLLVLGAEHCAKGVEATLYALLMSTLNVGAVVSEQLGALFTWALGITSKSFTKLWILVLICDLLLLLPLPLVWILIEKEDTPLSPRNAGQKKRSRDD